MDFVLFHAFIFGDMLRPESMVFTQYNPHAQQRECRSHHTYCQQDICHCYLLIFCYYIVVILFYIVVILLLYCYCICLLTQNTPQRYNFFLNYARERCILCAL